MPDMPAATDIAEALRRDAGDYIVERKRWAAETFANESTRLAYTTLLDGLRVYTRGTDAVSVSLLGVRVELWGDDIASGLIDRLVERTTDYHIRYDYRPSGRMSGTATITWEPKR